ncbi:MAG: YceI family protein [Xanthomonadaceae bacterium]|nr:YceI family protein [Xanthomonadaceae bacterium]
MKTLLLAALLSASVSNAALYEADKAHSEIGFKVKHLMVSKVKGKFKEFDFSYQFDEKSGIKGIKFKAKSASIDTGNPKRDEHLRNQDFFDVKKKGNEEITFESLETEKKGDKYLIKGKLTLKGITKDVEFLAECAENTDPWNNLKMGCELEGKINREDFNLGWNKPLTKGGLLLGKEVFLDIATEAQIKK